MWIRTYRHRQHLIIHTVNLKLRDVCWEQEPKQDSIYVHAYICGKSSERKGREIHTKKKQPYRKRNILINWIDYDVVVANFIPFFGMELKLFVGYLRVRKRQNSAAAVDDTLKYQQQWHWRWHWQIGLSVFSILYVCMNVRAGMNVVWIDLLDSTCFIYAYVYDTPIWRCVWPEMFTFLSHPKSLFPFALLCFAWLRFVCVYLYI